MKKTGVIKKGGGEVSVGGVGLPAATGDKILLSSTTRKKSFFCCQRIWNG